jgi:hypothetical protein
MSQTSTNPTWDRQTVKKLMHAQLWALATCAGMLGVEMPFLAQRNSATPEDTSPPPRERDIASSASRSALVHGRSSAACTCLLHDQVSPHQFIYFYLFLYYSYVHTMLGSFLPPNHTNLKQNADAPACLELEAGGTGQRLNCAYTSRSLSQSTFVIHILWHCWAFSYPKNSCIRLQGEGKTSVKDTGAWLLGSGLQSFSTCAELLWLFGGRTPSCVGVVLVSSVIVSHFWLPLSSLSQMGLVYALPVDRGGHVWPTWYKRT